LIACVVLNAMLVWSNNDTTKPSNHFQ